MQKDAAPNVDRPHGGFRACLGGGCFSGAWRHLAAAACILLLLASHERSGALAPAVVVAPLTAVNAARPADVRHATLPGTSANVSAPSLAALPDGRLAAAWLGEGHGAWQADQAIWFSTLDDNGWHEAFALTTREEAAGHTLAHLGRLSRPVLLAHAGRLDLWFNASGPGLSAFPGLFLMSSRDAGQSWSAPRRVLMSPWLQGGLHLVSAPLPLSDGGSLLPLAPEAASQPAVWLRLAASGQAVARQRSALPVNLPTDWPNESAATMTLPATHGPRALLRLPDGGWLLAAAAEPEQASLWLWRGDAQGRSWQAVRRIASAPPTPDAGAAISDPGLHMTPDGRIHLVYAWRGETLRHVSFTPAWLEQAGENAEDAP